MQIAPSPEIVDIIAPAVPPPAPPAYGWWVFIIMLILLIIIVLHIGRYRRNKARIAALSLLGKTRNALRLQHITPRAAAFAVGQALQGVPRLTTLEENPALFELLDRARYAPQEPEHDHAMQLLHMAQAFIEVSP